MRPFFNHSYRVARPSFDIRYWKLDILRFDLLEFRLEPIYDPDRPSTCDNRKLAIDN